MSAHDATSKPAATASHDGGAPPRRQQNGHDAPPGRAVIRAIPGYEGLQRFLDRFADDHPNYDRNVFVMMRFREDPHFLAIFNTIRDVLREHGMFAMRVDQKSYPDDDDLWDNIVIYMMGCRFGIAVFEDFDERDFNPNVAIKYGFMRALNKGVLILKEQRMIHVPSDATGNRYRPFDMMRLEETVRIQLESWLRDIGILPVAW